MNCPVEYWIWLQRTLGTGKDTGEILAYFGNPVNIYEAGRKNLLMSGIINRKIADSLAKYSPSQSYTVMKQCENNGWHIIPYDSEYYPPMLRKLDNSPLVLYVCGDPAVLTHSFCIGVVGTRNASQYGTKAAADISFALAKAGAVIVSGGALGIDSVAHSSAIQAGGRTVAYLGCGLGCDYLKENKPLRDEISENGALVSEFLPFTEPTRYTFPVRNRLISGMCQGTVVVEAGARSGSIITAKYAMRQGRDLFAVPGEIFNKNNEGTNNLLNSGAVPVLKVSDIISFYTEQILSVNSGVMPVIDYDSDSGKNAISYPAAQITWKTIDNNSTANAVKKCPSGAEKKDTSKTTEKQALPDYATGNAKKLYGIITDEPKTADDFVVETGMTVQDVLSAVTELELYGFVTMHSGKRYGLKIN